MIFLLLLGGWLWISAPSMHWLDTTELALSAQALGVGHPPGQVPHVILGALAQLIPLGDPSFRMVLLSAGACVFCLFLARRWARVPPSVWLHGLILSVGFSTLVSWQANRCEVYGLAVALTMGSLVLSLHREDLSRQRSAWFVWGLALLTHPTLAFGALPFLLRGKRYGEGLLFLGLALLIILFLPVRSAFLASWDFGSPQDWDRFVWYVTGKLYSAYDPISVWTYLKNVGGTFSLLGQILSPLGLLLSGLGLVLMAKSDRSLFYASVASLLLFWLPTWLHGHFWPTNPDLGGYLLPSAMILLGLALKGAWWMMSTWSWTKIALNVVWVVVLGLHFVNLGASTSLRNDFSARTHAKLLLAEPDAGAFVNVASFSTFSFMRYGQVVEGLRPDLKIRYRGLAGDPPFERAKEPHQWWELAMTQDSQGRYVLRSKDRRLKSAMQPWGWFYRFGETQNPDWLQNLSRRNRLVLENLPRGLEYPKEPLILNYLVHYLMARDRNQTEKVQVWNDFREMFPQIEGLEALESRP